mgnify:CR=1 FL=1
MAGRGVGAALMSAALRIDADLRDGLKQGLLLGVALLVVLIPPHRHPRWPVRPLVSVANPVTAPPATVPGDPGHLALTPNPHKP